VEESKGLVDGVDWWSGHDTNTYFHTDYYLGEHQSNKILTLKYNIVKSSSVAETPYYIQNTKTCGLLLSWFNLVALGFYQNLIDA
jgi:hypothetical protein